MATTIRFIYGAALCMTFLLILTHCSRSVERTALVDVPQLFSLDTLVAKTGDTVTIKGSGFKVESSLNIVSVAGVIFPVIRASVTTLTIKVPAGARSGKASVLFKGGQAGYYDKTLNIIADGEPFIRTVATGSSASPGDTIVLKGFNFLSPAKLQSAKFNGIAGEIVSASDTILKVVVPSNAKSGELVVTANGVNSLGYLFTIEVVNPLEDGRAYWFYNGPVAPQATAVSLVKGNDVNSPLSGTTLFSGASSFKPSGPNSGDDSFVSFSDLHGVCCDDQYNCYYAVSSGTGALLRYRILKIALNDASPTPTIIWDAPASSFTDGRPTTALGLYFSNRKLFFKLNFRPSFRVFDLDQDNLSPVQVNYNNDVAGVFAFSDKYLFYGAGIQDIQGASDKNKNTNQIKVIDRNTGEVTYSAQIDDYDDGRSRSSWVISRLEADPLNGNAVYVVAKRTAPELTNSVTLGIFKYDVSSQSVTKLYDHYTNWKAADPIRGVKQVTGFSVKGSHLYYANRFSDASSTGFYRLNNDGSSIKPTLVYTRMERGSPGTANPKAPYSSFPIFFNGAEKAAN